VNHKDNERGLKDEDDLDEKNIDQILNHYNRPSLVPAESMFFFVVFLKSIS